MPDALLQLQGIHKSFGPVQALRGVDLQVVPGEVHGLIGENGAGKSTLMKVLSGVYPPDRGTMYMAGRRYAPASPLAGREAGVSMIYQELVLAPHLTVEENITLGMETSRLGWIRPRTVEVRKALATLGQVDIDPGTPVRHLSIGQQQLVEIARALVSKARVVVLDEPTSSLTSEDTQALFEVVRRLRSEGVALIYISHFLEEVQAICDRYTVLRDGEAVSTGAVSGTTLDRLVADMVGRAVEALYPSSDHPLGEVVLEVAGLTGPDALPAGVGFGLRRGEIMGLFGLVGSGRSETLRALFGLRAAKDGTLHVAGQPAVRVAQVSVSVALGRGLNLLSENRKAEGLALNLSLLTNLTLSALGRYGRRGFLNLRQEAARGEHWLDTLHVKRHSAHQPAWTLSGGNQQKVCLARLLHHDSDILLLDEPTRGIDIGSKAEIYRLVHALAGQGKAVVVVSSYLPELMGICDTLGVMYRGTLSPVQPVGQWTDEGIMRFATSGRMTSSQARNP